MREQVQVGDELKVDWGRYGTVTAVVHHISKRGGVYAHRMRGKTQQTVKPQIIYWHSLGQYWSTDQ